MVELDILKEISSKLSKQADMNFTFTSVTSDFITQIYPPLQLKEHSWLVGLACLDTYYSFSNITNENNKFTYTMNASDWKTIELPIGCYEITEINDEIKRLMGDDGTHIEIAPNTITLGSIVTISSNNLRVDFSTEQSIGSVLGFNKKIIQNGRNKSDNIVNILNVNSILVNCDIIGNSYLNGSQSPVIYSFFPNTKPGGKIVQEPATITYLPVNRSFIQSIRIWLTDQDGNPIDFRGEKITCRMIFKHI